MKAEKEIDKLLSGKARRDKVEVPTNLLRKLKTERQRMKQKLSLCHHELKVAKDLNILASLSIERAECVLNNKSADYLNEILAEMEFE